MNDKKKVRYVKIGDEELEPTRKTPPKKKKKKKSPHALTGPQKVGRVLSVIGTTFLSMFLVIVITICIVATALTVYVMQFAESSFDIDLKDVELSFSTFIYGYDKDGKEVELKRLNTDQNRVWVDIDDIPEIVLDTFVAVEDQRFFEHDGVDWKRTLSVTVSAVFSGGTDGGSTITQQLVRDITQDNKVNVGRKLREIFRALALEQKYTKMDILESYLNRIAFGGTTYGIGSAAKQYFDKDVSELTVAEGAILAGIVRSPSNYNPYANLKNCRERQLYALKCLYDQGYITTSEYDSAVAEQVRFRRPVLGDYFGYVDERYNEYYGIQENTDSDDDLYYENESWEDIVQDAAYKWNGGYEVTQSWYVDAAINQVVSDLAEQKGITAESARELLYNGGYSVYINADLEMQEKIEKKFEDPYLCLSSYDTTAASDSKNLIQAAFIIMDYRGNVVAVAGGLGEKEGDNCFNRATQSVRAIGSTIKPLATYSPAIEANLITYSTMIQDISGKIPATMAGDSGKFTAESGYDPEDKTVRWPHNYQETGFGSEKYVPAWYAVQKSMNTVAVRVLSMVGLQNSYTQLTSRLGITTLDSVNDMAYSPLGTGSLTKGMKLTELAAAYAIFGNGGIYYKPYFYSKVVDANGKVVLEQDNVGTQAISKDTAWVTNRMLYTVTHDDAGSGHYAQLDNTEIIGKTGTANDMSNLVFAGLTPEYVGIYRIGYDDNHEVSRSAGWKTLASVWHDVMVDLVDTTTEKSFTPDSSVVTMNYCTETGLIATSKCPSTAVGYYRRSNIPISCDSDHDGTYWETHGDSEIPLYD